MSLEEESAVRKAQRASKKKASKKKAKPKVKPKVAKKASTEVSAAPKKDPKDTQIGSPKGIQGGRPKNSKNKATLIKEAIRGDWDTLMQTKAKQVFEAVVEKALDGDTSCMKMVLDRAIPASKAVDLNADLIGKTGGITINIEKLFAKENTNEVLIEDGEIINE